MHRTGRYRKLNLIFGLFPFVAAVLLALMREDSHPIVLWLSIVSVPPTDACRVASPGANECMQIPAGFGNAVVLQTMLSEYAVFRLWSVPSDLYATVALLAHLPRKSSP